jgi:lipopolysaccharide/colanic/teichoic acid biosynthesis glycosyltransferase
VNYPTGDEPVYVKVLARHKRYKPLSIQAKNGLTGRWQVWNGYGWQNTDMKIQDWEVIAKGGKS